MNLYMTAGSAVLFVYPTKKKKKTVYTQLKVSYMKTSNYNLRYQCETQLQFKSDYYILQFVICHIEWGII